MRLPNNQTSTTYTSRIIIRTLEGGGKHIFVPCSIENSKSLMLIDTGCSNTVFDSCSEIFANTKLHAIKDSGKNYSLNASIDNVKVGKIKDFAIGKFVTDINHGIFISLDHINTLYENLLGQRIIGILGSDFLRRYKAIIDFGKGRMSLTKSS